MRRFLIYFLFLFQLVCIDLHAGELLSDTTRNSENTIIYQRIIDGDTIFYANIEEITVSPVPTNRNRRDQRQYDRLVRDIKIVYPYALLASDMLNELNNNFVNLESEREKKAYVKEVEQQLMEEFGDDLKKLTISQGRLLIKLIDRETGNTSYDLVHELRGSFSAFFWQALARLFGSNLKSTFDAYGEDFLINQIIYLIEDGYL